ncbi:MAG: 3-deoxy-manno-octulosonate cytidylyltransferase [Cyclobacteriaceae bacterium]|nr:3-deoxy-manno-octulosonate cytidylyltransferase [Cyclobacteriaceae bacterium]
MSMEFLGIIPARYGSTRLEGKPLLDINGKPMIQWVYEKTKLALNHVVVATDDERIMTAVKGFGGEAVMTSVAHNTGTNRCLEALQKANKFHDTNFDVVINIQGDEPMLDPEQINTLIRCFDDPIAELATLVIPVTDPADLDNDSEVFVTFDKNMKALYFSRAVIPVIHDLERKDWINHTTFYKHLGLYGYTSEALKKFASLPQSNLEKLEKLEQLRWIENGGDIKIGITEHQSIPVDTQEDLERIRKII